MGFYIHFLLHSNKPRKGVFQMQESNVDLKIGVIGVGNGGCQALEAAHFAGFDTLALNTSMKDLHNETLEKEIPSFLLGSDGRGTGKDRSIAKQFLTDSLNGLFTFPTFVEFLDTHEVIIVVAATGGGTGSGASPLLCNRIAHATNNSKIVIFQGILPKSKESLKSQNNTLECVSEISQLNIPYMLTDLAKFEDLDDQTAHDKAAKHIVECLKVLRGEKMVRSKDGMIDERDELTIIAEPGYMAVYTLDEITKDKVEQKSLSEMMIDQFKHSPSATTQNDKIVKYMGVMVSAPEEFDDPLMKANFDGLYEVIGQPLDTFYNPHINDSSKATVSVIASGMSIPVNRLQVAIDKIKAFEESRKQKNLKLDVNFASFSKDAVDAEKKAKILGSNKAGISTETDVAGDIPDFLR